MATIRLATAADAEQVQAIYAPFCRDTIVSFEETPPTAAEMACRITTTLDTFPWLVCERRGEVLGYAYAGRHRERAAYRWSADVTVYVKDGLRRAGVGRAVYTSLFRILTVQGYVNVFGGVTLPNPASVGLHESFGFQPVGVYRNVGYKCGAWHDVGWWQLALRPLSTEPPGPLMTVTAACQSAGWSDALNAGQPFLRGQ